MTNYGYRCSKNIPCIDKRHALWDEQRTNRGFDDTETWALDMTISKFLAPRLKVFKKKTICHPHNLKMEEWYDIIQQMIDGFELNANYDDIEQTDEELDKIQKAWHLLAEWNRSLWW